MCKVHSEMQSMVLTEAILRTGSEKSVVSEFLLAVHVRVTNPEGINNFIDLLNLPLSMGKHEQSTGENLNYFISNFVHLAIYMKL